MSIGVHTTHLSLLLSQAIFDQVDFRQANLALQQSAERAFTDQDGSFDYVFNLAAETKYGQSPDVSNILGMACSLAINRMCLLNDVMM